MRPSHRIFAASAFAWFLIALVANGPAQAQSDPLPSWNSGASKQVIVDFVAGVTKEGGADYEAPPERIAVFAGDGELWAELLLLSYFPTQSRSRSMQVACARYAPKRTLF